MLDLKCETLPGEAVPNARSLVNGNGYVDFQLIFAEPRVTIRWANHAEFAQLNTLASSALNQAAHMLRFKAYMDEVAFRALFDTHKCTNKGDQTRFKLQINIFGLKRDSEQIGTLLSDSSLYLQEPYQRMENYAYHNPHVWTFDDLPDIDVWLAGLSRSKPIGEQMAAEQGWNKVLDDLSSFDSGHTDLDTSCLTVPLLKYVCLQSTSRIELTQLLGIRSMLWDS